MKTKLVPFDIEKAKNGGAKVVTRCGYPVKLKIYDVKNKRYPLIAVIKRNGQEEEHTFTKEGKFVFDGKGDNDNDLFIEEEIENDSKNKNMKTKLIPFDLAKAKAGAKIVNRNGNSIRIVCDNVSSYTEGFNLLVLEKLEDGKEHPYFCRKNGKAAFKESKECGGDLFIEEEEVTQPKKKKQGKQKPINNIEPFKVISSNIKPKFKVGDYIVNDSVNMKGKIVKLTDHSYQFSSGQCIPFEDNRTRLWDVAKDAKPGDVLAGEYGTTLIFKQMDDKEFWFSSYYNTNHERDCDWNKDCFIPATKKQRKQLFQKMKEEGYEWDSNKKELKKIKKEAVGKVKKEVKTRKMTRQELSDWLRDCPEEHREWKYKGGSNLVFTLDSYHEGDASEAVETKLIRRNHGEWEEPLIEIK